MTTLCSGKGTAAQRQSHRQKGRRQALNPGLCSGSQQEPVIKTMSRMMSRPPGDKGGGPDHHLPEPLIAPIAASSSGAEEDPAVGHGAGWSSLAPCWSLQYLCHDDK